MIEAKVIRIMPLPVVHPRWERQDSEYHKGKHAKKK